MNWPMRDRVANIAISDKSKAFNTARMEALELQIYSKLLKPRRLPPMNGWKVAVRILEMIIPSAMTRTGCAIRCIVETKKLTKRDVNFKPKTVATFEPKVRTY